jgi:hypothetical protein
MPVLCRRVGDSARAASAAPGGALRTILFNSHSVSVVSFLSREMSRTVEQRCRIHNTEINKKYHFAIPTTRKQQQKKSCRIIFVCTCIIGCVGCCGIGMVIS